MLSFCQWKGQVICGPGVLTLQLVIRFSDLADIWEIKII